MVYLIALLSSFLCLWSVWTIIRRPSPKDPDHPQFVRLLHVAMPYFFALACISIFYAVLSLPYARANLDSLTLNQLRELEQSLPNKATFAKDWVPPWFALALLIGSFLLVKVALRSPDPFLREGMSYIEKAHTLIFRYANVSSLVASALAIACGFTLFGDGLADQKEDITSRIHEARLRFTNSIDEQVRAFGAALTEQTIKALEEDDTIASRYERARGNYYLALQATSKRYLANGRMSYWEERQAVLDALIRVEESKFPDPPPYKALVQTDLAKPGQQVIVSIDPGNLTPSQISELSTSPQEDYAQDSEARRSLAAELSAGALERLGTLLREDPWVEFCYGVVAEALKEVISTALSKYMIEPVLQRFVDRGARSSEVYTEAAREVVAKAGINKYGEQMNQRYGKHLEPIVSTYETTVESLRKVNDSSAQAASQSLNGVQLSDEDRKKLLRMLVRKDLTDIAASVKTIAEERERQTNDADLEKDAAVAEWFAFRAMLTRMTGSPDTSVKSQYFYSLETGSKSAIVRNSIPYKYRPLRGPSNGAEPYAYRKYEYRPRLGR